MNQKRMVMAGLAAGVAAIATTFVFWPREEAAIRPTRRDVVAPPVEPRVQFRNATVLTAADPANAATIERTQPQAVDVAPAADAPAPAPFSDDPPISFMPDRPSLLDSSEWRNGWDEPVTEPSEGLLAKLPDWSAAAEWLAPYNPVAEQAQEKLQAVIDGLPPVPEAQRPPETTHLPETMLAEEETIYTVNSGDTLWTISQKVYGTGALFSALGEHNRGRIGEAKSLEAGQLLVTPEAEWLVRRYPQLCPLPRSSPRNPAMVTADEARQPKHSVGRGDTLERIAVVRLGRADRWREILALNHDVVGASGGYLKPGITLTLPDDARSAATVLRPMDAPR